MSLNDSERILLSEGLLTQCGSNEETLLHFEMSSVVLSAQSKGSSAFCEVCVCL